jgi:hypothetical protein
MRRATVVAVGITALIGVVVPGVAQADSTCPDGNVCTWDFNNYQGERIPWSAALAGTWVRVGTQNSIKNRLGNRKVRFTTLNNNEHCIDVNGERAFPNTFYRIFIGEPGSFCN